MRDAQSLIDGYLDETLTAEEYQAFVRWLQEVPEHRQEFANAVLLHDRMRGECLAMSAMNPGEDVVAVSSVADSSGLPRRRRWIQSIAAILATVCSVVVVTVLFWKGIGETPAAAAMVELNRLIAASAVATDRTYQIDVEEAAFGRDGKERDRRVEVGRPPKPPMDGAVLHVRGGYQFVLIRKTVDDQPFVTGSNGQTSWAVRPDGPARVSLDLTRFNRDLPGHEYNMPLINLEEGLEHLRGAYDVQLLPIEADEAEARSDGEALRLLVAVKKRGFRGPRRVEITYVVSTGQIRQLRFVDMPYGPKRLTLRLTLVDERNFDPAFFDHTSHHTPDRAVEFEE